MAINKIAAQKIIKNIPQDLRIAARKERQSIINARKADPTGAAYKAAHGYFPITNNRTLEKQINELKNQIAVSEQSVYGNPFALIEHQSTDRKSTRLNSSHQIIS